MVVVESPTVCVAMRNFQHECYFALDQIPTVSSIPAYLSESLQMHLKIESLELADKCGESIQADFGVTNFQEVDKSVDLKVAPLWRRLLHPNPSPGS